VLARNMGSVDRIVRVVAGLLLLGAGFLFLGGNVWRVPAIVVGLLALVTGTVGFCPAYLPFKLSTKRHQG
jgi:hypothetical protein